MDEATFPFLEDTELRERLCTIRSRIRKIVENTIHRHFTDHSLAHSDRVVETVGRLITPLQGSSRPLRQRELFVLYAACCLHDIGMQCSKCGDYDAVKCRGWSDDWESLAEEERLKRIRLIHAELSSEMIRRSASESPPPINISLDEHDDYPAIANLCLSHVLDVNSGVYQQVVKSAPKLRMALLSAILRAGDILEASAARSWLEKERLTLMPALSRVHWWKHYFVHDIDINPDDHRIVITFAFPPGRTEDYRKFIPDLLLPEVRDEFVRHRGLFLRHHIDYEIAHGVLDESLSAKSAMPPDVEDEAVALFSTIKRQEAGNVETLLQQVSWEVTQKLSESASRLERMSDNTDRTAKTAAYRDLATRLEEAGYPQQAYYFIEKASKLAETANDHRSVMELSLKAGELALAFGWGSQSQWHARRAQQEGDAAGLTDGGPQGDIHLLLAKGHMLEYDVSQAHVEFREAKTVFRASGRHERMAETVLQEARLFLLETDWTRATEVSGEVGNLTNVPPGIREEAELVQIICRVGSGGLDEAIQRCLRLSEATQSPDLGIRARIWQAYCAHLMDDAERVERILADALTLAADSKLHRWLGIVKGNLAVLSMAQFDPGANIHLASARELRPAKGIGGGDPGRHRLSAYENLCSRKIRDSVAGAWQAWGMSFGSCDWMETMWSARTLSLCLQQTGEALGALKYSLLFAMDAELTKSSSAMVSGSRRPELVKHAVEFLFAATEVPLFRSLVLEALAVLWDAVNDDDFNTITELCARAAVPHIKGWGLRNTEMPCLKLLVLICPRMNDRQCGQVARAIYQHPLEEWPQLLVDDAFKILEHCLARASEDVALETLEAIGRLVDAAPDHRSKPHVISLLTALGQLREGQFKEKCRDILSPDGVLRGTLMLQAGIILGRKPDEDRFSESFTEQTVKNIGAIVQDKETSDDSPYEDVHGEVMKFEMNAPDSGRKVRVSFSDLPFARCALRLKDILTTDQFDRIADTLIVTARHPDVGCSNRIALIQVLGKMGSHVSSPVASKAVALLVDAVRGNLPVSEIDSWAADSQHPLSRGRLNFGHPENLASAAIQALGLLARDHGGHKETLYEVAKEVLTGPHTKAPQFAFDALLVCGAPPDTFDAVAVERLPHSSPDISDGAAAYLGEIGPCRLSDWELFRAGRYIQTMANSPDPRQRAAAAKLAKLWIEYPGLPEETQAVCEQLLAELRNDFSWQVRNVIGQ